MRRRIALLIGLGTAAVFARAVGNGFVSYDDRLYVTSNRHVLAGLSWAGIRWAVTSFDASNWHPITWISHMIDVSLFGAAPAGHHAVNVLLHCANAALVFLLFDRLTGLTGRSAAAAALFALHPLRVESVAWASQRKDLLAAFFGLLALLSYVRSVRKGTGRGRAFVFYATGLMSKPTLVTLPVLMLLIDLWPLERLREPRKKKNDTRTPESRMLGRLILEKLPFFILAVASSALTLAAQRKGGATALLQVPFSFRLENAVVSIARYLGKSFVPLDLAVLYPFPETQEGWKAAAAALFVVAATVAFALNRRRPYLLFGWLWFLVGLAPTIGLVQVGWQAMADRYSYFPSIGLAVLIVWAAADVVAVRPAIKPVFVMALALALAAFSVLTFRQIAVWKDSMTLWSATREATDPNPMAEINYGSELLTAGRVAEAIECFQKAKRLKLDAPEPPFSLGSAYATLGRMQDARREFEEALKRRPDLTMAYERLGEIDIFEKHWADAVLHFQAETRLAPDSVSGHFGLALALEATGRRREAIGELYRATELDPEAGPPAAELKRLLAEEAAAKN
jgi:tetratricopeptide (TPR) repeat protein